MDNTYEVIIRRVEDRYVQISASSPERALQLATNIAGGTLRSPEPTAVKITTSPIPGSVKRVPR